MMTTFRIPAILALASLTAACTVAEISIHEDTASIPDSYKIVSISASQGIPGSKTSYDGEVTFSWTTGDVISVYCIDASVPANTGFYEFSTTGSGASATFTGSIPGTASVGDVALFPASLSHSYADGKYNFSVDREKSYLSRQSADIPMYGTNDGSDNFSFSHLTGAIKLSVNNIPAGVTQVKVTFTAASSKLSGTFQIKGSGPYTWNTAKAATSSEKEIVRYCPVSTNAFSVYIPYTEGTIWGDNTLLIQDYTGKTIGDAPGSTLYNQTNIGAIPVVQNRVTKLSTLSCDYRSSFGVNWSIIPEIENTDNTYPAIQSMKATVDADYLYILLKVKTDELTKLDDYDHYVYTYIGDEVNGSSSYWGSDKYSLLTAVIGGSNKDTNWWAVKDGVPSLSGLSSNREFSSNVTTIQNTSIYEVRIPRNHATTSYPLIAQTSSPIKIGFKMNDSKRNGETSGHIYSPEKNVGFIPSRGSSMYSIPQVPTPTVVSSAVNIDKTYHETLIETVNPERGLYRHNEYKFNTARLESTSVSCESDKTLVLTLFYLPYYLTSDLTSDALSDINAVFTNVRAAGKKAIVRFAYTWENANHDPAITHEASVSQLKKHIASLSTVLSDNADVIYVVQAGFIGTWGEWYYNGSDFDYTRHDDLHTVDNYGNRMDVIDALLASVPSSRQIALRTPHYKFYYYYQKNGTLTNSWTSISSWDGTDANSRLAYHNDAFLADANDMGTFHYSEEREMWKSQSAWQATGGETGFVEPEDVNPSYCGLTQALTTIGQYHYSYLNDAQSNNEIVKYWVANDIYPSIRKALGYRLVLNTAKITADALTDGSSVNFKLKISNTGSAPVIYQRPCKLVLIHNGTPTVLKDMGTEHDIRNISPGGNYTYDFNVTLTQDVYTGDKLAIWMPDADIKSHDLDENPAYSIRLANSDVTWSDGYNVLYTF